MPDPVSDINIYFVFCSLLRACFFLLIPPPTLFYICCRISPLLPTLWVFYLSLLFVNCSPCARYLSAEMAVLIAVQEVLAEFENWSEEQFAFPDDEFRGMKNRVAPCSYYLVQKHYNFRHSYTYSSLLFCYTICKALN